MSAIARLLGIQAGEGAAVSWLIVLSLFNGIFSAFFLTAANSLFLTRYPVDVLPIAYISAALVGYIAVSLLSWLERRMSFGVLLTANLGGLLVLASGFWILRRFTDSDWVVFAMFVVVGPMFNLIALGYWGLAGRLFDVRQAKRLFGLVGAGEEVSTIAGLFSTPLIIPMIGDPGHLVILAAAGLTGSFVTVMLIARRFRGSLESTAASARAEAQPRVGLLGLLRVRYFRLMAACVVLLNLALYIVDFSFLAQARTRFPVPGELAQFFGTFFGALKIVEFLLKVGVSGPLLNQFGLHVGLLVLPVVLAISAILALVIGSLSLGAANFFVLVALAKLVAVSGRSSTFEPSFRVLYQPVSPADRVAYQSHVEGSARQFAILVVGLALLFFSRGGADNALALYYVLVPILGLWIAAAVLVHREYRVRLFDGVQGAATAAVRGALEVLMPYLRSADPARRRLALRAIERVEPVALPAAVVTAIDGCGSPAPLAAVEWVGSRRMVELEATVAELGSAGDLDPEVRKAVRWASTQLSEVQAIHHDRMRLELLGASVDARERQLAAIAMGYGRPADADRLSVLLSDREVSVRQAALTAAGRLGNPEFRPLLVRNLAVTAFAPAAAAALVTIGAPALTELDRALGRSDQSSAVRRRILRVCQEIGGDEAMALLVAKLELADRTVRGRAIDLLVAAGHRATAAQVPFIEQAVETLVREIAWDMSVLVALDDTEGTTALREAIEREIAAGRRWLFDALAMLYDATAIAAVRDLLATGAPRATVSALEMLDLLVAPVIKPFVFPVLEGQSPHAVLRKADLLIPRHQYTAHQALRAIVSREFGRIGLWTRALALDRLGRASDGVATELVAFLFHHEPLLREIAAMRIAERDRGAWERHRKRLRFDIREALNVVVAAMAADDGEGHPAASVFGRVELLRRVSALAVLPADDLVSLAAVSEVRRLAAGQRLPSPRDPQNAFFVTLEREVALRTANGLTVGLPPFTPFTFEPDTPAAAAVAEGDVLRIDPNTVFDIAAEQPELIPGLVQAAEALIAREVLA